MNRTLLYYPTIKIPTASWLRQGVLYWDEVSSIVPMDWEDRSLINLGRDIHYLMAEGQFRPIRPEDLIFKSVNHMELRQFEQEFKTLVASNEFLQYLSRKYGGAIEADLRSKISFDYQVHRNKTSQGLCEFLDSQGLIQNDVPGDWIYFEPTTALLYMSLLAKYLADIDTEYTTISTDRAIYNEFNFKRALPGSGFPVVSVDLKNVLPVPRFDVPFETIVDFKRKREDNLINFKKHLSDFQSKISNAKSQAELKEHLVNFQDTLAAGVLDLSAVLKDSKIEYGFKTLKSLTTLKSPIVIGAVASVANTISETVNIPLALNIGGLGAMAAIELATGFVEALNKERVKVRESPFSYIYQAQKAGIIQKI
jgi:hypothetical protein